MRCSWAFLSSLLPALAFAASVGSVAFAADRRVDPAVVVAMDTGVSGPLSAKFGPVHGSAPVLLQFSQPVSPPLLARLQSIGAILAAVNGELVFYDRFVPSRLTKSALQAVLAFPDLVRVSLAQERGPQPLDRSAQLIGLERAWGARPVLDRVTGKGITVADLDSNVDVFHPHFFRGDAGYFSWIDTNNNGKFDPDLDAIDLNNDGKAGPDEVASVLLAQTVDTFYGTVLSARSTEFDPASDWLFLDSNKNHKRDFGAAGGFDDKTPAFGEPIFTPDDVNRNGKLDPEEKLVRLGSSKFKKIYVHLEYYAKENHVYERGVDLCKHRSDFTESVYGYGEALHATAVLSIIGADLPLVGRKWVGIAPDADLILGWEISNTSTALSWALKEKPDVVLHEYANWYGDPLDGSDAISTMVDQSSKDSTTAHSCPVGNTGGAKKHTHAVLTAKETKNLSFQIPSKIASQQRAYYVDISLNIRQKAGVELTAVSPSGDTILLTGPAGSGTLKSGANFQNSVLDSGRGTRFVHLVLYTDSKNIDSKPIPDGSWTLKATGAPDGVSTIDGYLMDDVSGWAEGVAWDPAIATDDRSIGIPATSDSCIAVGAHTGHPYTKKEPWYYMKEPEGTVRSYSGRGPRIDGTQKPDIVAPDNPWAASAHGKSYGTDEIPHGAVAPFGGTSGAGPHVTGVTALLAQSGIRGDSARKAIREGAIFDSITGSAPNTDYGWGRLSAAGAMGVKADGKSPIISVSVEPTYAKPGSTVRLRPVVADGLEIRWDEGYDGTWDTEFAPAADLSVTKAIEGKFPYKVRVRDAEGRVAEAVATAVFTNNPPADASVDSGADSSDPAPEPASDDGCGCRTTHSHSPSALLAALAIGLLTYRRRPSLR